MALTVAQTIALALEASHSRGKTAQGLLFYNSILTDLCQTYDFAEARGQYLFTFAPNTGPPVVNATFQPSALTAGGVYPSYPGNQFGSGPYILPVDYIRLSGSSGSSGSQKSFIWWLQGVPYPVIPMDLAEFDLQVQQAGLQSFVWLSASDMSTPIDDRILNITTGDVTSGSTTVANVASTTRLIGGNVLGVAGQGIVPGTMLTSLTSVVPPATQPPATPGGAGTGTPGGGVIMTPGGSAGGAVMAAAGAVSGPGTPGGGVIMTPGGGAPATPGGGGSVGPVGSLTLSQPANATITGASLMFGYCPVVYIYPPPQSELQAMIRYQKRMPDVFDTTRFPWFHNDGVMLKLLASRMCDLNDDDRAADFSGRAMGELSLQLASKDDDQSHPKRVELDRRAFGRGWIGSTKITKRVGW